MSKMNEILRAKRLTEEILARAAAIKNHMVASWQSYHQCRRPCS